MALASCRGKGSAARYALGRSAAGGAYWFMREPNGDARTAAGAIASGSE